MRLPSMSVSWPQPASPSEGLPDVVTCKETSEFDYTEFDFGEPEVISIRQTDEHGVTHTIVLSPAMMAMVNLRSHQWKAANNLI
jgi:hypothetical protein